MALCNQNIAGFVNIFLCAKVIRPWNIKKCTFHRWHQQLHWLSDI